MHGVLSWWVLCIGVHMWWGVMTRFQRCLGGSHGVLGQWWDVMTFLVTGPACLNISGGQGWVGFALTVGFGRI